MKVNKEDEGKAGDISKLDSQQMPKLLNTQEWINNRSC